MIVVTPFCLSVVLNFNLYYNNSGSNGIADYIVCNDNYNMIDIHKRVKNY